MRWLRSHRRPGAWMALLALVLQLGLAFGHVHAIHEAQNVPAVSAAGPSDPASGDPDDGYCATCAIIALLTGAQAASPPVVTALVAPRAAEIAIALDAAHIVFARTAFRSRAPPLS